MMILSVGENARLARFPVGDTRSYGGAQYRIVLLEPTKVNWGPLSDVMLIGIPKRATQFAMKTLPISSAEVSEVGMASGHLVK